MEKDQEIAALRALLAERDAKLAERDAKLAEREAKLAETSTTLAETSTTLARRDAELAAVESTVSRLQRELARLKQQVLGTSRERFEPGAAQLALWGAERPPAEEPKPKRKRRAKPHGRRKPPAELPEEVIGSVPGRGVAALGCCD